MNYVELFIKTLENPVLKTIILILLVKALILAVEWLKRLCLRRGNSDRKFPLCRFFASLAIKLAVYEAKRESLEST